MNVPTLLPTVAEMDALALDVAEAVTVEAGAGVFKDAALVERAVLESLERIAVELDLDEPYASRAALPARVYGSCIQLGALYLKRAGAAYGIQGYEDMDPGGMTAEFNILRALRPGEKVGWGVA